MSAFDVGRNSIQQRIVREFFATTGLVLVLTSGALFGTAFVQFQGMTNDNLIAVARVIGGNSEASLLFNDEQGRDRNIACAESSRFDRSSDTL